jgi:hypothetical protein
MSLRDRFGKQRDEARRGRLMRLSAFILGPAAGLWARDARADFDFQLAANANGGWLRHTPAMSSQRISTSARDIAPGSVKTRGGLGLVGFAADVELTVDDRWKVPLAGGAVYWAVGSYDATISSLDGSIARLRPWSTFRGDILLPGIGHRWKHRRNMWGVAIRTGISFVTMGGTVAAGAQAVPLELDASTFLLQFELEGCRRLDPTTRVCLQIVPRVYEHELLNGLTAGLRLEWGR